MTTTDYEPIDCDQHSVLELLAMRRAPVLMTARAASDDATFSVIGKVLDVLTRDGAEYLELCDQAGTPVLVRLDRLLSLSTPDGVIVWRQKSATGEQTQ